MPEFESGQLGRLEFQPEAVITFPAGLPAFETERDFLVVERPGHAPLVFLQSLQRPDLCFITVPVSIVDPEYQILISEDDRLTLRLALEAPLGEDLLGLAMVTVGARVTANLAAPVVIHSKSRLAVQAIRGDHRYHWEHPLPEVAPC